MRVVTTLHTMLGESFWPTVREAVNRLGSLDTLRVGPGFYQVLEACGATREGSKVVIDVNLRDRNVLVTSGDRVVRVVVGFKGRGHRSKSGSSHPRCNLVPPSQQGDPSQWIGWTGKFPVVGRVRSRTRRL